MPRACLLVVLVLTAGPLRADSPKEKSAPKFTPSKEEQEVIELTNKERKDAGLPPLRVSEKLFKAARAHAANMAKQKKLTHTLDDKDPGDRLKDVSYAHRGWAENVAEGQLTPAEVLKSWMESEGHKANILSQHTEIGIGIATAADGTRYWTQVFANPE
jgi:uncharacterized protein YkwD